MIRNNQNLKLHENNNIPKYYPNRIKKEEGTNHGLSMVYKGKQPVNGVEYKHFVMWFWRYACVVLLNVKQENFCVWFPHYDFRCFIFVFFYRSVVQRLFIRVVLSHFPYFPVNSVTNTKKKEKIYIFASFVNYKKHFFSEQKSNK